MIHIGDGTWNLRVFITDLHVEKTLRVKGDLHIGGVMLRLVDPGWFENCLHFVLYLQCQKNYIKRLITSHSMSFLHFLNTTTNEKFF